MYMSIKVEGAKELEKTLMGMEPKIGQGIMRKALRKAAKVFQQKMKHNAAALDSTGWDSDGVVSDSISDNIVVRAMRKRRHSYGVMSMIDPKAPNLAVTTQDGKRYYIPTAIEYGHAFPGRGGGKNAPKDVPAKPFMRPAYDSEKGKAEKVLVNELRNGIEKVGAEKR